MELNILLNTIKNMVEPGTEVDVQLVQKGMTTLTGITIGTGTVRAVVYMEQFEEMFQESGYVAVASEMIEICQNENWKQTLNIEEITSWEYAKENIMLCIAPKDTIGNALTIPYLDLELYFRVNMEHGTYKLTK